MAAEMAEVIDGVACAADLRLEVQAEVERLAQGGVRAGLATIMVGRDYPSVAYEVRLKRLAEELGVHYRREAVHADADTAEVLAVVERCNEDPEVNGILVLRPLPPGVSEAALYQVLDPEKDVEAVTPVNAGLLALGTPHFVPSTPAACYRLLDLYLDRSADDRVALYRRSTIVVVGRSLNVGRPMVALGMARDAIVVSCDEHASAAGRLAELTLQADILIVAAGVPGLVGGDLVREGAIVVDVGINPQPGPSGETRIVGDVRFSEVLAKARAVTPVPGGVGPVTDVWLVRNAVLAARRAAARTLCLPPG
ncbi:MAG: bifunctional 5,10-methylenetetrahydrofolate dehydrogenase/5,10-methenyltetrahydrofolate cyclohydrolase [Acidimicrobiales bacterium]